MKHFWLNDNQQAMMDSATNSANIYGYIGLFEIGAAWKTKVAAMVGTAVAEKDYLRLHKIMKRTAFVYDDGGNRVRTKLTAAIRLDKNQATIMKLRHGGGTKAFVRPDPTGESWGNMLIAQAGVTSATNGRGSGFEARQASIALNEYLSGSVYGPTVETVADFCNGLDLAIAKALVWRYADDWGLMSEPVEVKSPRQLVEQCDGDIDPRVWGDACNLFGDRPEKLGKVLARDFYLECGSAAVREWYGVGNLTGTILGD